MNYTALFGIVMLFVSFVSALGPNLVCYYDAKSHDRTGYAKFALTDLEVALQFCTHVIYGHVGINADNFQVTSLNPNLDIQRRHLAEFTALKERNPSVKFLLSIGGEQEDPEKYLQLLEAGRPRQTAFIQSARDLVRSYNFDGLDLAFQFPRNKPRKVHSQLGTAWKSIKKLFTGDFIVDPKSGEHREEFTDLIGDLKSVLRSEDLLLSLTVAPNVNSSWYFNIPSIINNLDMVNLGTFDFVTPQRNPQEADLSASLYENMATDKERLAHYNVNFQVEHWTNERVPPSKLNVGIASYGVAWKMTKDSGTTGVPIVGDTDGPANAGIQTKTPGVLSWPEICLRLPNPSNINAKGDYAPLQRVSDPLKRAGTYAFRPADENNEHGVWVSYDDPDLAASKAAYVKVKSLGGVAMFDLSMDDFRGQCTGDKFPILRAIKYRLL